MQNEGYRFAIDQTLWNKLLLQIHFLKCTCSTASLNKVHNKARHYFFVSIVVLFVWMQGLLPHTPPSPIPRSGSLTHLFCISDQAHLVVISSSPQYISSILKLAAGLAGRSNKLFDWPPEQCVSVRLKQNLPPPFSPLTNYFMSNLL